jgi:GntR family transcriptional regulator/GntR family frlABCD operon transcriptional regulator
LDFVALPYEAPNRMESSTQYQLLYHRLKKEILADVYPIGSILPSENDLCAAASLSRSTVRQALSQLEAEGYIIKQKGKGSIVKSKSRSLNLLSFHGFSAMVDKTEMSTLSVQEPTFMPWPEDFPFELSELEKGAGCIHFARVRSVARRPVMYELTFVPNLNLPRFVRQFKLNQSFFEFLAKEYQLEITGMEQQIWAVAANSMHIQHLQVESSTPLLKIIRKYHSNRSHLHLYSILYCNTEKYALGNTSGVLNQSI